MEKCEVVFYFDKRMSYGKTEYFLSLKINGGDSWTIETWPKKPTEKRIEDVKDIVKRSFDVYSRDVKMVLPGMNYNDVNADVTDVGVFNV